MRVIVVGAGIGGLTLAQALVGRGVEVVVIDRDIEISRTGGYRLHLNAAACRALRTGLPSSVFTAMELSSAPPESFERMHVTDRRLRVVATVPNSDGGEHLMIGRVALRTLLAHGLTDRLRLATTVVRYESTSDGLDVVTDCGERISGDLVVAADGARSVIAAQAAGRSLSAPVGLRGFAGTAPLTSAASAPDFLRHGPLLAVGTRGTGLFLTLHCPRHPGRRTDGPVEPIVEPASVIWGLIATDRAASALGAGGVSVDGVDGLMDGWSPWVRAVIGETDPHTLGRYTFRAASPSARMVPWTGDRVAALGDAVHAMPPTGGRSASTAIVDAADLADVITRGVDAADLADVITRGVDATSLGEYHDRVSVRGADAVRESLTPARWITRSDNAVGTVLLTAALPAVARIRSLMSPGRSR